MFLGPVAAPLVASQQFATLLVGCPICLLTVRLDKQHCNASGLRVANIELNAL